jgi:PDZ domain-containing protein
VQQPGPVFDTLGKLGEQEFITVSNAPIYAVDGRLDMTTVRESGGPQQSISLGEALWGWLHPDVAVVPRRASYAENVTAEQARTQSRRAFASSQEIALGAVLRILEIDFTEKVFVVDVIADRPAAKFLKSDDQILLVNGVAVDSIGKTIAEVRKTTPGDSANLVIARNGNELTFDIPTVAAPDSPTAGSIGAFLTSEIESEVSATFADQRVGGPSAGLVFALAIYDRLTPGELAAGKHIAVTGTITTTGEVGSIGGIRQKMIGAKKAGATIFLLPAENCAEAVKRIPSGLNAIPVRTLSEAIKVLQGLNSDASGRTPTCTAP